MKKSVLWIGLMLVMMCGMLAACGRTADREMVQVQEAGKETKDNFQETMIYISGTENERKDGTDSPSAEALPSQMQPGQADGLNNRGEAVLNPGAIAEQIFEIELSEYKGMVCFTPFAPGGGEETFHMEITQNENLLASIPGYVPEWLAGETFTCLDAVAFYDVNFDGNTDIVLIETYGKTSFAVVYYGFAQDAEEYERYFAPQSQLSEALSRQLKDVSVPGIRDWISGGKKNGEFSSFQEAYQAVGKLCQLESGGERTYDLIYFNDDDIPELVVDTAGYFLSLYTYADGRVYPLIDQWGYGAMGNAGYTYSPRKNSMRNDNADFAGAIVYTTYMTMGKDYTLDEVVQIASYYFDDVNGNGMPDDEEIASVGRYGVHYIQGKEVSEEECAAYDLGGYQFMGGRMPFEELERKLKE